MISDKIIVTAIATFIIILSISLVLVSSQSDNIVKPRSNITVYFFHGAECSHCHIVMPFMNATIQKYPNVKFEVLEIWYNETNRDLAISMNNKLNVTQWGVPEVIIGDVVLSGSKDIPEKLEGVLNNMTAGV